MADSKIPDRIKREVEELRARERDTSNPLVVSRPNPHFTENFSKTRREEGPRADPVAEYNARVLADQSRNSKSLKDRPEISSGSPRNLGKIDTDFLAFLDKFNKAIANSTDIINKLSKETSDANKGLQGFAAEAAKAESGAAGAAMGGGAGFGAGMGGGAGGGSSGGFATALGRGLEFGGRAATAFGNIYGALNDTDRFRNITSEQQQTAIRTSMASLVADQQQDYMSSLLQGNTGAMRRISQGTFGHAFAEGNRMGTLEKDYARKDVTALGAKAIGGISSGTGAGIQAGYKVGEDIEEDLAAGEEGTIPIIGRFASKIGLTKSAIASVEDPESTVPNIAAAAGGAAGGIQGAAATLPGYLNAQVNVEKNISAGQARITSSAQQLEHDTAVNRINDQFTQMFRNQVASATGATRGAGGNREELMRTLTDPGALKRMAAQGYMSPEQAAQLTGFGVQNIGAGFRGEADITRAGQVQRGGTLSAEQYMQSRASLAGAGGSAKDLEDLMTKAVAAGMNNSRNIQELVRASTSMAARTAAATATNTAGAAVDTMTRAAQSFSNLDPNLRASVAQSGVDKANELQSSRGMTPGNVLAYAEIRKAFPKASAAEVDVLMSLDASTIKQMQMASKNKDNKQFEQLARSTGAAELFMDKNGMPIAGAVDKLTTVAIKKDLRNAAYGGFDAFNTEALGKKMISDEKYVDTIHGKSYANMTQEEKRIEAVGRRLNRRNNASAVEGIGALYGTAAAGALSTGGAAGEAGEFVTGGAPAVGGAKMMGAGASSAGGLEGLAGIMKNIVQTMDVTKMANASKEAYDGMKLSATSVSATLTTFNQTINSLDMVVNKLKDVLSQQDPAKVVALLKVINLGLNTKDMTKIGNIGHK